MYNREYVRMCRKAHKLQAKWQPESGDWWYVGARDLISPIIFQEFEGKLRWCDIEHSYNLPKEIELYGIVWLPRLDQIQNMILKYCQQSYFTMMEEFLFFINSTNHDNDLRPIQLWFSFYMSITHHQYWQESRWIKESKDFKKAESVESIKSK